MICEDVFDIIDDLKNSSFKDDRILLSIYLYVKTNRGAMGNVQLKTFFTGSDEQMLEFLGKYYDSHKRQIDDLQREIARQYTGKKSSDIIKSIAMDIRSFFDKRKEFFDQGSYHAQGSKVPA